MNKSNYLQTLVLLIFSLKIFLNGTFEVNFDTIFMKKYKKLSTNLTILIIFFFFYKKITKSSL